MQMFLLWILHFSVAISIIHYGIEEAPEEYSFLRLTPGSDDSLEYIDQEDNALGAHLNSHVIEEPPAEDVQLQLSDDTEEDLHPVDLNPVHSSHSNIEEDTSLAAMDFDYHVFTQFKTIQTGKNKGKGKWEVNIFQGPYNYGKKKINQKTGYALFHCVKCLSGYGDEITLYAHVENWEPDNPAVEPVFTLEDRQPIYEHSCFPGPYDGLPTVLAKTCQQRILQNPTVPINQIWSEVYNQILREYGYGDEQQLTPDQQQIQDTIKLSLKGFNNYKRSLYRIRRATYPETPESHRDFDPLHPINLMAGENMCKLVKFEKV